MSSAVYRGMALLLPVLVVAAGCGDKNATDDGGAMELGVGGVGERDDASVPADLGMVRDLAVTLDGPVASDDGGEAANALLKSLKFETPGPIAVAVDKSGGPLIAGALINSSRFGDITLAAQADPGVQTTLLDPFIVAFNSAGVSQWGERFGDSNDQSANVIAVNGNGVALVAGLFIGSLQLRADLTLSSSSEITFLAAIDVATGAVLWARPLDLGSAGVVFSVAADPTDGGFVVAAMATAAVSFDSFAGTAGGGKDIFVAKLKADTGGVVWAQQRGGSGDQVPRAVAVDAGGIATLVGQFNGVLDFGTGALPTPPMSAKDLFVAKLDATGAATTSVAIGQKGSHLAEAVAIDAAGDVIIAGYLAGGAVTFAAPSPLVLTPQGQDGFVAKLTPDLKTTLWAKLVSDSDGAKLPQEVAAVAVDQSDNVVAVGVFQGSVDFGVGPVATAIRSDAFALKLGGAAGRALLARSTHGSQDETATGVGINRLDGSIWVVGTFYSSPTSPPLPNWGDSPSTELVFLPDDISRTHTFLVHLAP